MQVAYLKEAETLLIPGYPQATFTQIAEVKCVHVPVPDHLIDCDCRNWGLARRETQVLK